MRRGVASFAALCILIVGSCAGCGGGTKNTGASIGATQSGTPFFSPPGPGVTLSSTDTSSSAGTSPSTTARSTAKPSVTTTTSVAVTHSAASTQPASSKAPPPTATCAHNVPIAQSAGMSITLSASTCLTSGQTITVVARHFKPREVILVVECADRGASTLNPDCTSPTEVTADATGTVRATLPVIKGPFPTQSKHIHAAPFPITFGGNHPTCSATQLCLVSASEETASGGAEADEHITFA